MPRSCVRRQFILTTGGHQENSSADRLYSHVERSTRDSCNQCGNRRVSGLSRVFIDATKPSEKIGSASLAHRSVSRPLNYFERWATIAVLCEPYWATAEVFAAVPL